MQTPRVYSLQELLDADLDPNLCKLMLHQIKSPLLQHSFQMTTDDERNGSPDASFLLQQKNNKRKQQEKPPKDHQRLDSFTITNSYYETSRIMDNNVPIVSPLQNSLLYSTAPQEKRVTKPKQKKQVKLSEQLPKKQSPQINWCGSVFDTDLQQNQVHVNLDIFQNYVRKKIFKKKQEPKCFKLSFKEAAERLQKINEIEMYFFLTFIGDTMGLLRKIAPYKRSLSLNHEAMCSHLLKNHPVEVEFPETLENVNRIKNRTSSEKLSSVLLKYSVPIFEEDNKKKTNLIEYDMEFIIKILNEVEEKIQNYTSRKNIINQLETIYQFLQESFPGAQTLKQKIYRLLVSLHIDDELIKVDELSYFWKQLQTSRYYTKHKFIKQLCQNDIIVQENVNYHQHLKQLGFQRNA